MPWDSSGGARRLSVSPCEWILTILCLQQPCHIRALLKKVSGITSGMSLVCLRGVDMSRCLLFLGAAGQHPARES